MDLYKHDVHKKKVLSIKAKLREIYKDSKQTRRNLVPINIPNQEIKAYKMADTVRKFFTKSLKSAATTCSNNQLANRKTSPANQLNMVTKNAAKANKMKSTGSLEDFKSTSFESARNTKKDKKKTTVVPFPKPLYNPNLTTYTDNTKLKEMLFKGTDVSPYSSGVKRTTSYEQHKNKHLANLIDRESLKKLQYDLLINRNFAFINFQSFNSKVGKVNSEKDDYSALADLECLVSQLKQEEVLAETQKPELQVSEEFLSYTKGVDNTGGCNTLGLNLPSNEEDLYKQFSFKNKYGSTLPVELIQLKNHLPEISIGCYSLQYMGYDKDWYDFAKRFMSDVKLRGEIMSKLESIKYKAFDTEKK